MGPGFESLEVHQVLNAYFLSFLTSGDVSPVDVCYANPGFRVTSCNELQATQQLREVHQVLNVYFYYPWMFFYTKVATDSEFAIRVGCFVLGTLVAPIQCTISELAIYRKRYARVQGSES